MARTPWVVPLAVDARTYSKTSVCMRFTDDEVLSRGPDAALSFTKAMAALLDREGAAYDILAYRGVPAGFRVWTGATIETADLTAVTEWLEWAYAQVKSGTG